MLSTLALAMCLAGTPDPQPPRAEHASAEVLATDGYRVARARYLAGSGTIEEVVRWSQWLRDAERAKDGKRAEANQLDRLRELVKVVEARVNAGTAPTLDLLTVRYQLAALTGEG
jgi:outer membrane protein TolC